MPLNQSDFVTTYGPLADDIAGETGLDRNVVLGVIAQESGWGNHFVGNNPFGISDANGRPVNYGSVGDAARAFSDLMASERYRGVGKVAPQDQPLALRASGYNTADPAWAPGVAAAANTVRTLAGNAGPAAEAPSVDDIRKQTEDLLPAKPAAAPTPQPGAAPVTPPPATDGAAATPSVADLKQQTEEALPSTKTKKPPSLPEWAINAGPPQVSPPAPAAAPPTATPPNYADMMLSGEMMGAPTVPDVGGAGQRIVQAARSGYQGTESSLTPYGRQLLGPVASGASDVIDVGRGAVNALSTGALQTIYEAGNAIGGPSLGRDLATMAMVAPAAEAMPESYATMGPRNVLSPEGPAPAAAPTARMPAVGGRPAYTVTIPKDFGWSPEPNYASMDIINPLDQAAVERARAAAGPTSAAPSAAEAPAAAEPPPVQPHISSAEMSEDEAPLPSAGAAGTPRGAIPAPTLAEKQRSLRMAIDESAATRTGPGMIDNNAYVTDIPGGTLPERAGFERDFSPQVAIDHKESMARNPAYKQQADALQLERSQGMESLLRQDAGDDVSLANLKDARRAVAPDAIGAFDNERPVPKADTQGIVDDLQAVIDGPEGKTPAVAKALTAVRDTLYDKDGNLETLPSRLYGAKKAIDRLLDAVPVGATEVEKGAAQIGSTLRDARSNINDLIESGADNYANYRQQYRQLSQPVNQQEFLQRYWQGPKKLTGADGQLVLAKVNKLLEDIYADGKGPQFKKSQSLTADQIQNIVNVRNELAARKLATDVGRTPGSDSYQMFARSAQEKRGVIGNALAQIPGAALHAAAVRSGNPLLSAAGFTANIMGAGVRERVAARAAAQAQRMTAERESQLLSQAPVYNRLHPPPSPYPP